MFILPTKSIQTASSCFMTLQPAAMDEQVHPAACSKNPLNEITTFSTVYLKTSTLLFCYKTSSFAIH